MADNQDVMSEWLRSQGVQPASGEALIRQVRDAQEAQSRQTVAGAATDPRFESQPTRMQRLAASDLTKRSRQEVAGAWLIPPAYGGGSPNEVIDALGGQDGVWVGQRGGNPLDPLGQKQFAPGSLTLLDMDANGLGGLRQPLRGGALAVDLFTEDYRAQAKRDSDRLDELWREYKEAREKSPPDRDGMAKAEDEARKIINDRYLRYARVSGGTRVPNPPREEKSIADIVERAQELTGVDIRTVRFQFFAT